MVQLPPEAGDLDQTPFEPENDWLASAPKDLQIAAMRRWFLDRYEDPANETPWDGEDKTYVFIWGGPYDPSDEIQGRFGGVVPFEVMWDLIISLWREVGDEWAPIQHEGADYEEYVTHQVVVSRHDPHRFLEERIEQIFAVLDTATVEGANRRLLHQMAHSSLIAALEAYLADILSYWIGTNDKVLRRIVSTNKDFQGRSLPLAELFDRFENLENEVRAYLADFVWHRLDKVKPMLAAGLEIQVPEIGALMKQVRVRHDIVHRAGRREDGSLIDLQSDDLIQLRDAIQTFVQGIEQEVTHRFPTPAGQDF